MLLIFIIATLYTRLELTPGMATAVIMYVTVINQAVNEISMQLVTISKVYGASFKCARLIVEPPLVEWRDDGKKEKTTDKGELKVDNVVFAYPSKPEINILKGVTVDVTTNQIVALVGASGCGKSSIIQLMERFYDPVQGKMWFNEDELKDLDNSWYHQQQCALVQQEPILFSGSIRSNIIYGCKHFESWTEAQVEAKMIEACKKANCYDFIMDKSMFPDGFE